MDPDAANAAALANAHALHCRVTTALLEAHRRRHQAGEPYFTFAAICKAFTAWRRNVAALE